jgi:hypothetical protein
MWKKKHEEPANGSMYLEKPSDQYPLKIGKSCLLLPAQRRKLRNQLARGDQSIAIM